MTGKSLPISELNTQRRRAVELRLRGETLASVGKQVGLSTPTIVAAMKAFRAGGWVAVNVKPRGRPTFTSQPPGNNDNLRAALLAESRVNDASSATQAHKVTTAASSLWTKIRVSEWLAKNNVCVSMQTTSAYLANWHLLPTSRYRTMQQAKAAATAQWLDGPYADFTAKAKNKGATVLWLGANALDNNTVQIYAHTLRGLCFWHWTDGAPKVPAYIEFFDALQDRFPAGIALVLPGKHLAREPAVRQWQHKTGHIYATAPDINPTVFKDINSGFSTATRKVMTLSNATAEMQPFTTTKKHDNPEPVSDNQGAGLSTPHLTHLQKLEAQSIHIMREVMAEADNPVMLYSMGKDSAVMLHLANKAFYPAKPPFPLLHVDTTWKFREMYDFRDRITNEFDFDLITYTNPDGLEKGVNPFSHGSALHTDIMKTEALKQALDKYEFDVAFGGARRDEEKSRAKERVFSFRSAQHRWEPKNQRPELWKLYNTRKQRGESIRVFPLSNWTELDIWQYIHLQDIPIVPLYLAAERPVVERDGMLLMVDDERMPLSKGEVPMMRSVRFRTLGCYPLTGAIESTATTVPEIIQEMLQSSVSERQGRMIDHDMSASMEKKKQEGYF